MPQRQFVGTVLVNGSERRLAINGNPLGRTVIQVDGITAYDKKPFVHKETIDFDIVPGKKAILRWQQVSLKDMECDITVDGRSTALPSVALDGVVRKPVTARAQAEFQARCMGAGAIGLAAVAFLLNYFEIQTGSYYPKFLVVFPVLLFTGTILLVNPQLDLTSPAKKKAFVAAMVVLLIAGWFFKNWFLSTFAPQ